MTCLLCGRVADDLVPATGLAQDVDGLMWCPDPWPCLIAAGGLHRRPQGVLW